MVGIFTTSITAGRLMSRNGRYRIYPILGAATITVALVLLANLGTDTPYWFAGLAMYVMGLGLGLTLQILIVIVQNSVERSDMGVATSSVAFFRQMGGSFGTALFGAILSSRLAVHLTDSLQQAPRGSATRLGDVDRIANDVQAIRALPDGVREVVTGAFSHALSDMFLTAVPLVLVALGVAFFIKEVPLATRQEPAEQPPAAPPVEEEAGTISG
jgi:MFS family permease